MRYIILCFLLYFTFSGFCQDLRNEIFKSYQIEEVNSENLYERLLENRNDIYQFTLGNWKIQATEVNLFQSNYRSLEANGNIVFNPHGRPIPVSGHTSEGYRVSLTIGYDFIYGFIKTPYESIYYEPHRYYNDNAKSNEFIRYSSNDVLEDRPLTCGLDETTSGQQRLDMEHKRSSGNMNVCYDVEYGICNDYSMFQKYGGIPQAEAHAIGVTNNVNTDYEDTFNDSIRFVISGQYTINCVGCDPWSSSTNPSTLLNSFRSWAVSNLSNPPLNINHDVASLWSNRDFNGTTIGVAYRPGLCITNSKYNILQDYTGNAARKRVLVSHELGHNFNMVHDASGTSFIMSPSVTTTSTWSTQSVTEGSAYIDGVSCLSFCAGIVPQVNFKEFSSIFGESGIDGVGGLCNEPYIIRELVVEMDYAPTADVKISVTADNASQALNLSDFEILTDTLTFTNTGNLQQVVQVRIYDDQIEEGIEDLLLNLQVVLGSAVVGPIGQHTMSILSSGDLVNSECCSEGMQQTYGSLSTIASAIFRGSNEDARSRIIVKASDLNSIGLGAGIIDQISLYVHIKGSTGPFENFRIGMTNVNETDLSFSTPWYNTQEVFIGDVSTTSGWNNFALTSEYIWDGSSNLYLEFCFDNTSSVGQDIIGLFTTSSPTIPSIHFVEIANTNGCSYIPNGITFFTGIHPYMRFRSKAGAIIANQVNSTSNTRLNIGETAHFYDANKEVIASIKNVGDQSMECVNVTIVNAGLGRSSFGFNSNFYADKQLMIDADFDALYELTLYYRDDELNVWSPNQAELNIVQSTSSLNTANANQINFVNAFESINNIGAGSARSYTATIEGDGFFALTDGEFVPTYAEIGASAIVVQEAGKGLILFSPNGTSYNITLNANGQIQVVQNGSIDGEAKLNGGNLIFEQSSQSFILKSGSIFYELSADLDGTIDVQSLVSLPSRRVDLEKGNLEIGGLGSGFVLRDANNNCWLYRVSNLGRLISLRTACP